MGTYLNPGNSGFSKIINSDYVDKSGLIGLINKSIGTTGFLTCVSRPRRFGKSYSAKMLCAYYDKSCNSEDLFNGLEIHSDPDYGKHLNKYDVIYLDMSDLLPYTDNFSSLVPFINLVLIKEICSLYPDVSPASTLSDTLVYAAEHSGNKFVMIIDEWDAPIRENPSIQHDYLALLRSLFKSSRTTDRIFAAVYMTGILPIKKDGSQSALSDFREYTMVSPAQFAKYVGFTEDEVRDICEKENADFEQMKKWYDGYHLRNVGEVYNPNSVIQAAARGTFTSYWTQTSALDSLLRYISMDFDGLSKTVAELMGGSRVKVNVLRFDNDLVSFRDRDSVITVLIHLGYLGYDEETQEAFIPNEELRLEFLHTIKDVKKDETIKRVADSNRLIMDTVNMDAEAVAAQIEKIHEEEAAALFYNNEQALRGIIKLAYFAYKDYYIKFEELPAGAGFADIVYFPKKDSSLPALLVELKWDNTAKGAIDQIKDRHYPEVLKDYGGEIILVGISYDKKKKAGSRTHSCVIEKMKF